MALGCLLGAFFPRKTALVVAVCGNLIMLLFSGVMPPLADVQASVVGRVGAELSLLRWGTELQVLCEGASFPTIQTAFHFPPSLFSSSPGLSQIRQLLGTYGADANMDSMHALIQLCVLRLLAYAAILHACTLIALVAQSRTHKV